jgi:hypothetical protein
LEFLKDACQSDGGWEENHVLLGNNGSHQMCRTVIEIPVVRRRDNQAKNERWRTRQLASFHEP